MKDELILSLYDWERFRSHDAIGFCSIKMSSLCINGGGEFTFDIIHDDDVCGELTIISQYTPVQEMSYNFDTKKIKSQTQDAKMSTSYTDAEIEVLKNGIITLQQQLKETERNARKIEWDVELQWK